MTEPSHAPIDKTLTSRYECKYLIDERCAALLRHYLSSHVRLDPFSERSEDLRYRVHSLYLDTPGLQLYRDTAQGIRNRFKLRLRYYSMSSGDPVFLEVKKRSDVIVRKSRERVSTEEANEFLHTGTLESVDGHGADLGEFLERCRETGAQPALRIKYWREAYESRGVDPVRITFDTQVEHCMLSTPGLEERRPEWRLTPLGAAVILEVKFTDRCPRWVSEMLRRFQLSKLSVAKYAESIDSLFDRGQRGVLERTLLLARPRANATPPPLGMQA